MISPIAELYKMAIYAAVAFLERLLDAESKVALAE